MIDWYVLMLSLFFDHCKCWEKKKTVEDLSHGKIVSMHTCGFGLCFMRVCACVCACCKPTTKVVAIRWLVVTTTNHNHKPTNESYMTNVSMLLFDV